MALKREFREEGGGGGEGDGELPIKRRHLFSTILTDVSDLQEYIPHLEPLIRKVVQEAVQCEFNKFRRSTLNHVECLGSRTLQLQICSNLPNILFTGSRVMSEDRNPVKIILCDPISKDIVTSGPHSSVKVAVVVLDGDFCPDDLEDWSKEEFDSKIVRNREGKRPLVSGELTVQLQNGVGYIGQLSFTDNSSWSRSGKFRLGAKVYAHADETNIREAISCSFKVKDHRGESYQKHYPPSLYDDVWRLDKIAKDGTSHKSLAKFGISNVQDLLRCNEINPALLRSALSNASYKMQEAIIRHATTCTLDERRYMYQTAQGMGLLFNCIFKVVGMTYDGLSYHSIDDLSIYQMKMVEELKTSAFANKGDWVSVGDQAFVGYQTLLTSAADNSSHPTSAIQDAHFQVDNDQLEMQMNNHHSNISSPDDFEVDRYNKGTSTFEIGECSQLQECNFSFTHSLQRWKSRMEDICSSLWHVLLCLYLVQIITFGFAIRGPSLLLHSECLVSYSCLLFQVSSLPSEEVV
ncbi:calmodulin-binding protein 60 B-like isoform X2 [Andrographis paniculata]|uniref:calmodulin-binding protein 60 B-like isoform X2 n=1 Tax=Andrographis paniculata TaxID=175694 RepID=UPI0021E7AB32|nr:calmodulin-binding protein 60 B-like isoform X2 [Andrographis paniculata]